MGSAAAPKLALCIVDSHPAEHDCRRVRVDFRAKVHIGANVYTVMALEMCGAGITVRGDVPVNPGDNVELRISFPGMNTEVATRAVVHLKDGDRLGCEYWAANAYQQQFIDAFVKACARRQELRSIAASAECRHHH